MKNSFFLVPPILLWAIFLMESYYDGSVPLMVCTQQICVPHPKYPSTRVAIRLPSLGFQFSPARYHRLMQVINVFSSQSSKEGNDSSTSSIRPWDPADFEGPLSVLSWKVLKQTPCLISVCLSVPNLLRQLTLPKERSIFCQKKEFFLCGSSY